LHKTRVTWWIRDGHATLEGSEIVPGQLGKHEAEVMLDHATVRYDKDLKSLPTFCERFYSCADPDDWGIISTELIE
jgi:hypothetical protein